MKTYTLKSGKVMGEQELINTFYCKKWKSYFYSAVNDVYILFSALDKFNHLCDKTSNKS